MSAKDRDETPGSLRARFGELLRTARALGEHVLAHEDHETMQEGAAMHAAMNRTDVSREVTSRVVGLSRGEARAPHPRALLGATLAEPSRASCVERDARRRQGTASGEHVCVERRSHGIGGRIATVDLDGLCVRAALHARGGRVDYALRLALACIAEEPLDPRGYLVAADIQEARGRLDEAEQLLKRVLLIAPSTPRVRTRLAALGAARRDRDVKGVSP